MASITLKGSPVKTLGELPAEGTQLPNVVLVDTDFKEHQLESFVGKKLVLNVFPSIDTPVCAASVTAFNERAAQLEDCIVLCVSRDLPFALKRFCGDKGIENVTAVSAFRDPKMGRQFGFEMADGPLAGLFARAVLVTDPQGRLVYSELVPEIAQEPNYDAALEALQGNTAEESSEETT